MVLPCTVTHGVVTALLVQYLAGHGAFSLPSLAPSPDPLTRFLVGLDAKYAANTVQPKLLATPSSETSSPIASSLSSVSAASSSSVLGVCSASAAGAANSTIGTRQPSGLSSDRTPSSSVFGVSSNSIATASANGSNNLTVDGGMNAAGITGGVIGAAILSALMGAFGCLCRRRSGKRSPGSAGGKGVYQMPPMQNVASEEANLALSVGGAGTTVSSLGSTSYSTPSAQQTGRAPKTYDPWPAALASSFASTSVSNVELPRGYSQEDLSVAADPAWIAAAFGAGAVPERYDQRQPQEQPLMEEVPQRTPSEADTQTRSTLLPDPPATWDKEAPHDFEPSPSSSGDLSASPNGRTTSSPSQKAPPGFLRAQSIAFGTSGRQQFMRSNVFSLPELGR